MRSYRKTRCARGRRAVLALAAAAAACSLTRTTLAGTTGSEVTISISGSTAMRNFTISPALSLVAPGGQVAVGGTSYPASPTYWSTGVSFQVAPATFGAAPASDPRFQFADALRLEWHEQGSVEGILEMANDQIAPVDSITASNRNPTSGNKVYVNTNPFSAVGNLGNHPLGQFYATPGATGGLANFGTNGVNPNGGQNAVQLAISDVTARQGFAVSGAGGAFNKRPGEAGYGKGNAALAVGGLGVGGVSHQLADQTALNMPTTTLNPRTGANFTAGPWNTAGVDNLDNETVAITATLFAANPGTGLDRLNRKDAQFLQATGRLANGADFNVATRDVNSGTLNVAALNAGLDPSFAVGDNDNGNGNAADGAAAQVAIGAGIKFSNKTAGGAQLRPTIQNARMALGHLSMSDANASTKNATATPLRALAYRDDDDDLANNSNNAFRTAGTGTPRDTYSDPASNTFVQPNGATIVDGSYVLYQNETYVTVKKPGAAFAGDTAAQWAARTVSATGIQGDNATNDVRNFRNNILTSVSSVPLPTNLASAASAADGLLQTSFILPQIMQVKKGRDGINESFANPAYNAGLSSDFLDPGNGLVQKFNTADPNTVKAGSASFYGGLAAANPAAIPITAQNFLFGNFRQNGVRDFEAVKAAVDAQAKLFASPVGTDMFTGSNSTAISGLAAPLATMNGGGTTAATKGDLIVMGDFNADGKFSGKDLALMARGAALADSAGTTTITLGGGETFGAAVRRAVLRKNAALDFMHANTTAQQKLDATNSAANDPTGANAFNKLDVNRDGLISRFDAKVVDGFSGKDYRSLTDQLDAVITDAAGTRQISLVDVELNDTGDINRADFDVIKAQLVTDGKLIPGDANFDGIVNVGDLGLLSTNFGASTSRWGLGDFNGDGIVNVGDLGLLSTNFGASAVTGTPASPIGIDQAIALSGLDPAAVPEPSALALAAVSSLALFRRQRRRK